MIYLVSRHNKPKESSKVTVGNLSTVMYNRKYKGKPCSQYHGGLNIIKEIVFSTRSNHDQ